VLKKITLKHNFYLLFNIFLFFYFVHVCFFSCLNECQRISLERKEPKVQGQMILLSIMSVF